MESGTLLHLALLRKTSKANKRPKFISSQQKKTFTFDPSPTPSPESNFTLTGWSTQQAELSLPLNLLNANNTKKLRQSLEQRQKNHVLSERTNAKTSQCSHRPRLRSQSFRKQIEYKPANQNQTGDVVCQRVKELNRQYYLSEVKLSRLAASNKGEQENRDQKENTSTPQLGASKFKVNEVWGWQNSGGNPRSFANFLNFNVIRERKFFKL